MISESGPDPGRNIPENCIGAFPFPNDGDEGSLIMLPSWRAPARAKARTIVYSGRSEQSSESNAMRRSPSCEGRPPSNNDLGFGAAGGGGGGDTSGLSQM